MAFKRGMMRGTARMRTVETKNMKETANKNPVRFLVVGGASLKL
jgi:hypothetical protein